MSQPLAQPSHAKIFLQACGFVSALVLFFRVFISKDIFVFLLFAGIFFAIVFGLNSITSPKAATTEKTDSQSAAPQADSSTKKSRSATKESKSKSSKHASRLVVDDPWGAPEKSSSKKPRRKSGWSPYYLDKPQSDSLAVIDDSWAPVSTAVDDSW